jgi:RNA polymerase sigma factor (TIGR02999 family)
MNATLLSRSNAEGDDVERDELFGSLYSDLRRIARRELNRQGSFGELGVTSVLHQAYLRLAAGGAPVFADRARFLAYTARVMRGSIIDEIRRRRAQKRGGLFHLTSLGPEHELDASDPRTLLQLADALDELAAVEPDLAEIVELKFFCGVSFAEIAALRGVSERTVRRDWDKARLYLHHALSREPSIARHAAVLS